MSITPDNIDVAEATTRIEAYTPEWSNIAPGDPGSALIDMFAWLA